MPTTAAPRVLLPRPAGRGTGLRALLEGAGCAVEQHPFVDLVLEDTQALREAAQSLADGRFTHLVLTSPRAVDALLAARPTGPVPAGQEGALRLAVGSGTIVWTVGEGTASALRAAGIEPDLVASGSGAALVDQAPAPSATTRVLLPLSAAAAPTVPEGLTARGHTVETVTAYRPDQPGLPAEVTDGLPAGRYAAIVLTSSMIAERAADLGVHADTAVIAIGRPTEETARARGLSVAARAEDPSDTALARAVLTALDLPVPASPQETS